MYIDLTRYPICDTVISSQVSYRIHGGDGSVNLRALGFRFRIQTEFEM